MPESSETSTKDIEEDPHDIVHKIEAWFQKHFGHITPGTPDHAVVVAAKTDLVAALTAPEQAPVTGQPTTSEQPTT